MGPKRERMVEVEQWEQDKAESDRYIRQVKALLGLVIVEEASWQADAKEATDLVVAEIRPCRIACRIRNFECYKWRGDFTIRSHRPQGADTELIKILSGWGDYLFYGFSDVQKKDIFAAVLLDLSVFRKSYVKHLGKVIAKKDSPLRGRQHENDDSSSSFVAFSLDSFPPELIAAQWPREYHLQKVPKGIDWCNII